MSVSLPRLLVPGGLVIGAALGMAGTFAPDAGLRGLLWGIDGTALIIAAAALTIQHLRRGNELLAVGFLVFVTGETLVVSGSAMDLGASSPAFGAGTALWAASLALVSARRFMPLWNRITGLVGAALFAATAGAIFSGNALTPLSQPLPFFAYPFLAATLVGWAWTDYRNP